MTSQDPRPELLSRARSQLRRTGDPALDWAVTALESLVEPEHRELDAWVLQAAQAIIDDAEERAEQKLAG